MTAPGLRASTPVAEVARNRAWSDAAPATLAVVVSTVDRAEFLPGLLACLEAQQGAPAFEAVVVDDGSVDGTWEVLGDLVTRTPVPICAVRLASNSGAAIGRNRGVETARAPFVAFTDDDCLPAPGWLAGLAAAFGDEEVAVVQGRTEPEPGQPPGPWDRSLWVTAPTRWLETCNVAYRRSSFEAVGGFDESDPLFSRRGRGRGFGEDTWLGARVLAAGGRRCFAADAVVRHRWRRATYAQHVAERRLLRHFPELARRVPTVADTLWGGLFLSRRTAAVDLAVVAAVAAALRRRPVLLVGALPWLRASWGPARARRGSLPLRLGQAALADLVGLAALLEGSVRQRRPVL